MNKTAAISQMYSEEPDDQQLEVAGLQQGVEAMTPIVDLVRVYALNHRVFKTNTGERLEALRNEGVFSEKEYQELMQAYYYLMGMRLKKQASQILHDRSAPDNYMDPKSLTNIEQVTLKEIFKTIQKFQLKIKVAFTHTLFG